MSYQQVTVIGRLGKDPEKRATGEGKAVVNFSVAAGRRYTDREGKEVDNTTWFNCVAFERTAEIIAEYVRKGHQIHVSGRIKTEQWTDKSTGEVRYGWKLVVDQVTLLQNSAREDGESRAPRQESAPAAKPATQAPAQEDFDDDIPF